MALASQAVGRTEVLVPVYLSLLFRPGPFSVICPSLMLTFGEP